MDSTVPIPPIPTATAPVMRSVATGQCGPLTTQLYLTRFFSALTTPPPPPTGRVLHVGGGATRALYIWDSVRVKLTHPLFICTVYVVEFFQSSLKSSLFLVGELFIHLDIFINQTARPDSLYLGIWTVRQTDRA
jgi:hypothetical protein